MYKQPNAYIVRTPGGKYGFFYWSHQFVKGACPVHLISDKGVEDQNPTLYDPRTLTITISLVNGRSKRMVRLPNIKYINN